MPETSSVLNCMHSPNGQHVLQNHPYELVLSNESMYKNITKDSAQNTVKSESFEFLFLTAWASLFASCSISGIAGHGPTAG